MIFHRFYIIIHNVGNQKQREAFLAQKGSAMLGVRSRARPADDEASVTKCSGQNCVSATNKQFWEPQAAAKPRMPRLPAYNVSTKLNIANSWHIIIIYLDKVCVHLYIHACVCKHIYIYVCMRAHTHAYVFTHDPLHGSQPCHGKGACIN